MKTTAVWILILWLVLVVEQVRTDLAISGSLVMPFAIGCVFWLRNGTGCVVAGCAMITRWLLQPTLAPVEVVAILLLSTVLITRSDLRSRWSPTKPRQSRVTRWLQPAIVLLLGLICQAVMQGDVGATPLFTELSERLIIAAPCLACILFATETAEQFGWRRKSVR